MKTSVFFLFLFILIEFLSVFVDARQAPSFAQLEGSINGKVSSFKNNCSGKLNNFGSSVNGKLDSWNSNYRQAQQNFQNSVNARCDSVSSGISNSVNALQSSMDNKFDSAGFSAFKNDSNDAFKKLASDIGELKNNFKAALESDLGSNFSNISSDFDTLNSGLQTEASDISNDFDAGGELSDAVDEAEDAYQNEQAPPSPSDGSVAGHWVPRPASHPYAGWADYVVGAGTYTVRIMPSPAGVTGVFYVDYGDGTQWISKGGVADGSVIVFSHGGQLCGPEDKPYYKAYLVKGADQLAVDGLTQADVTDSDNDGSSNAQEAAAGTNPNDASSVPAVEKEPDTKAGVDGAKTGISALDEIIAKLSPDFTAFSSPGTEDFSLSIPIEIGSYSQTFQIGPFDSLLDGKLTWMRTTIRLFITAIMAFVLVRNLIKVLKEW